jgi:hypothetical protein
VSYSLAVSLSELLAFPDLNTSFRALLTSHCLVLLVADLTTGRSDYKCARCAERYRFAWRSETVRRLGAPGECVSACLPARL